MAAFLDVITQELEQSNRELRELAVKNEEASIAKYKFLANVRREIATPLKTVIRLERKIRKESTEDKIREYSRECHLAGEKVYGILGRIFDFLEMEAGDLGANEAEYRVSTLLQDLHNEIMDEVIEKGLEMVTELPPDIPSVLYGDELRIRQILVNLLNNAVRFTEKGSIHLKVTMEKIGPADVLLHFSVKDTGVGITPENFAEVQRVLSLSDDRPQNMLNEMGLGLNVTQRLLKLFGSELHMETELGKGTTCSFDLRQRVLNWFPMKQKNAPALRDDADRKPPITEEELAETWEALREIAAGQDMDSLDYMLETLDDYRLPEREAALLLELQTAAKENNWELIAKLVQ
jgi:signal transduction histidine kinase